MEHNNTSNSNARRGGRTRVYVAGKMMFLNSPERDWRGLLRFRELDWTPTPPGAGGPGGSLLERLLQLRDLDLEWDEQWTYVGPHFLNPTLPPTPQQQGAEVDYFYQLDDEPRTGSLLAAVLNRDDLREFTVDEREKQAVLDNARHQIQKCDVLYARIPDHKDSYWTFVEIGIATALGKRVYIDCPVESHDTWLLPLLSEQTRANREEYLSLPWAMYKH